ncbi:MAG: hypothetical protein EON58_06485 [Alphaproteobacteria bacterium]|nr:MAG: hypothetical protein EON58_06485 [Alphaproteobacteria bacterium]
MKDVSELFADLAAALEDLHSLSIEGQEAGLTSDMVEGLLAGIKAGLTGLRRIILEIAGART